MNDPALLVRGAKGKLCGHYIPKAGLRLKGCGMLDRGSDKLKQYEKRQFSVFSFVIHHKKHKEDTKITESFCDFCVFFVLFVVK
jgi:hypothetical protein